MDNFERVPVSHFGVDIERSRDYRRKLHKIEWLIAYFKSKSTLYSLENRKNGGHLDISLKYLDYQIRAEHLKNVIKTRKELFYEF